jgi:hypothetical protein
MAGSSQHISVWDGRRPTAPRQAVVPGFAVVFAIAAEFRRATAAAGRYERLRRTAPVHPDPEGSPARRVYVEFYSGR